MEYSVELNKILNDAIELAREYPTESITPYHILLAMSNDGKCVANRILSRFMDSNGLLTVATFCVTTLTNQNFVSKQNDDIDEYVSKVMGETDKSIIDSGDLLQQFMSIYNDITKMFETLGIQSLSQLKSVRTKVEKDARKKKAKKKERQYESGEMEKLLPSISALAANGDVDVVYDNDDIISEIFVALSRCKNNNALLVGERGSGKSSTVKHIANLILNDNVPKTFEGKRLISLDFFQLLIGAAARGVFEARYKAIVEEATKNNSYILFIDDIESVIDGARFSELPTESVLLQVLENDRIMVIATTTPDGYSKHIMSSNSLCGMFQKIKMKERNEEEMLTLLSKLKQPIEDTHRVLFNESVVKCTYNLCKRYSKDCGMPESVLDTLDETGSRIRLNSHEDDDIAAIRKELGKIAEEMDDIRLYSASKESARIDELTKKEVALKAKLGRIEKEKNLHGTKLEATAEDIKYTMSLRTGVPLTDLDADEKTRLKGLSDKLKAVVIGQDDAVDEVCRVVKRQRTGLANPNKPSVLLALGNTGTGKSYLAKKLAEQVFGSEQNMVRLDMSEYSDKMSVNKLYGSAAGYVGYDEGGILTEAIKRNSHCVLLLDEIEKANEEVFNVMLQVFDEGRLTDNKGVTVDFRDVIIIMTSNIGAKEVAEKGKPIGFDRKEDSNVDEEIIRKALKYKFKPEFLNRIDSLLFFKPLTNENISNIVRIEINKLAQRIEKLGYSFDKSVTDGKVYESIVEAVLKEKEYGARPVLREIRRQIEDKVADLIIENTLVEGHIFTADELI